MSGQFATFTFYICKRFCAANPLASFLRVNVIPERSFLVIVDYCGAWIAIQATFVRPEYFANPSLFPTWPVFDSERALSLFVVSMAIVLAPKAFGWFAAMINIPRCLRFGGPILLTLSALLEMVMSGLYAPILMVSQFGVVFSILRGKDGGSAKNSFTGCYRFRLG